MCCLFTVRCELIFKMYFTLILFCMSLVWLRSQLPACHSGGRVSNHARFAEEKMEMRHVIHQYFGLPCQYNSNNAPQSS
jgi:hypothetical protein